VDGGLTKCTPYGWMGA